MKKPIDSAMKVRRTTLCVLTPSRLSEAAAGVPTRTRITLELLCTGVPIRRQTGD
jgi:hypothetical protein